MPAKKKADSEAQVQSDQPEEATPNVGAFESHIKDGPTQDDLNPAYAPPEDDSEAATEARKLADEAHGDDGDSGDSKDDK